MFEVAAWLTALRLFVQTTAQCATPM